MTAETILIPDLPEFLSQPWPAPTSPYGKEGPLDSAATGLIAWNLSEERLREAAKLPSLRWVLTLSSGVDRWLGKLPPAVALYNASALHAEAVAQHATALLLAAARGIPRFARAREWQKPGPLFTLQERHVVIWGYGHVGRRLGQIIAPLGAVVRGLHSGSSPEEIDAALRDASDLVLLLPLTPQTRGLVDERVLGKLKAGTWIYNLGRGELLDTEALLGALDRLGGAALDVTDPEPLPATHPLWQRDNVLITPHVAGSTTDVRRRAVQFAADFAATRFRHHPIGSRGY